MRTISFAACYNASAKSASERHGTQALALFAFLLRG